MSDLQVQIIMTAANGVEAFADKAGGALDYTEDSLEVIEKMLKEASAHLEEISQEQRAALSQYVGCYILEVGRLQLGGEYRWHKEREQPVLIVGEPDFHVAMACWDKVQARLAGDSESNIPFFFSGFAERARLAKAGDHVIFV